MTIDEVIQRLLDEKKITVKDALDLLKAVVNRNTWNPPVTYPTTPNRIDVVVMYGVQTTLTAYNDTSTTVKA